MVLKTVVIQNTTFSVFSDISFFAGSKKNYSIENSSTIIELSIDTLMGGTKRVATQNIKFEDSVNSVWKSVFGTLVQPGFWCNKKNRLLFNRLICENSKNTRLKSWCNKSNLKIPRKLSYNIEISQSSRKLLELSDHQVSVARKIIDIVST